MALAPLSQTIFLTEDGSVLTGQAAVTIPLRPSDPTITNTLGTSPLLATGVDGAVAALTPIVRPLTDMGYL